MEMMGIALIVALVAGLAGYGLGRRRVEREVGRVVQNLRRRVPGSNGRPVLEGADTAPMVELTEAVRAALDAERALRLDDERDRQQFQEDLASLAHDIRTPLAGARGYLELYAVDQDPQNRARYLAAAHERLATMGDLVDDLFAYTRSAEASENTERVSVLSALAEALAAQYPAMVERGWEPRVDFVDEEIWLCAERAQLVRVFSNLVTNALRYGAAAPAIVQRGSQVLFSNRVAQPQAIDVGRLFERSYRGEVGAGIPGSGLGLAIVARLCAGMDMAVDAHMVDDKLTIEMRLPARNET